MNENCGIYGGCLDCEDCKEQDLHCEDCSMYEYDKDRMSNQENNNMELTKYQQIYAAIDLLKHHGYKVYKDYSMLIGKWVAFWQEG